MSERKEFDKFRKRVLLCSLFICIVGLPVGLYLKLPYVWLLSIAGLIISIIKLKSLNK
jgi:hypothetical protein